MVSIEIKYEERKGGGGVATHLTGLPDNWDEFPDEITDKEMLELTPEQQFGVIAMNILEKAKPGICEAMGRLNLIKLSKLQ